jgi:hypothetical protein
MILCHSQAKILFSSLFKNIGNGTEIMYKSLKKKMEINKSIYKYVYKLKEYHSNILPLLFVE